MELNKNIKEYKFQSIESLRSNIIFVCLALFVMIFTGFYILPMTEDEVYENFTNQELIGSSNQRGVQNIQMFLVSNWGKKGLVIGMSIAAIFIIDEVYKIIFTLRRYRKKLKMYRKGLVDNLNDYHKQLGIIGHIRYEIKNRKNRNDDFKYSLKFLKEKNELINYEKYK